MNDDPRQNPAYGRLLFYCWPADSVQLSYCLTNGLVVVMRLGVWPCLSAIPNFPALFYTNVSMLPMGDHLVGLPVTQQGRVETCSMDWVAVRWVRRPVRSAANRLGQSPTT